MSAAPPSPFTYALIGAGRVGTSVARLLQLGGNQPLAVVSRSEASAERAASLLDAPVVASDELPDVDVVLIGAGEAAIGDIAGGLKMDRGVVVHFAGAYGIGPLKPAIERGLWGCALHPVQACPDVPTAIERLPGSTWGVTCTWPAKDWAHRFVTDEVRGIPVDVEEENRPIWHAAAVSTSNGIAALMAVGERLLSSIGIEDPEKVLGPLARGTVDNAIDGGGGAATLTGPAIRGDSETIARHLSAIGKTAPQLLPSYALAAEMILEAGTVDAATIESIRRLLEEAR